MKENAERRQRVMVWLGVACLGLTPVGPLSAQQPKLRATFTGHTAAASSVAYSPDGKILASGGSDNTVKLWDVRTGKEQATLKGHTDVVISVAFSPDGVTLVSVSKDKTIKLWDVQTGKEQATLKGHTFSVKSLAYSPDGKVLASGSENKTVKLWDVQVAKKVPTEAPKKDSAPEIKKLAQARVDAAHRSYDVAVKLVQEGSPGVKLEDVHTWSVRWLSAQRDMSSKQEGHISALSEHLKRMRQLAQVAGIITKAGHGSPLYSPAADFYLREAELWLGQAKVPAIQADK